MSLLQPCSEQSRNFLVALFDGRGASREGDAEGQAVVAAFQEGLRGRGWTAGRNVQFEIRWASGDPDKARSLAKELIGMAPDVIVPSSNLVTTIVQQETRTCRSYSSWSAIRSAAVMWRVAPERLNGN